MGALIPNAWIVSALLKDEPFWSTKRVNLVRLETIRVNRARIGICWLNGQRIARDHPMHNA